MSLAGYLSEYSLAEVFNFVQEGNKTGLLWIEPETGSTRLLGLSEQESVDSSYYVSFQFGRVMSIASGWDDRNLLKMIEQRKWISPEQSVILKAQLNGLIHPFGTSLKSRNIINAEQLKLLFNFQVVANISKMFKVHQGRFKFDPDAQLMYREMTGLSLSAKEAALLGLRVLKDWSGLAAKLPAPESALQRFSVEPGLRLDTHEYLVWQIALGEMSIANIAAKLSIEIARVQQIGFRLSSIGLMQEVSAESLQPPICMLEAPQPICVGGGNATVQVSTSFLSNLMGFLKKKGK